MVGALLGAALLVGFLVLAGSSAFFLGRVEGGDLGFHGILMTAAYPVDAFAGVAKALLYSVVPAAFVASVPARLVADPDAGVFAAFVGVTALFCFLAWAAFHAGLRRYTSGSVWTRA